jgi:hypothetical protein
MYRVDEQQSFSFWLVLLILPLFFMLGWSTHNLQSNVRGFTMNFMKGPFVEETSKSNEPEIVSPIPASDIFKPEKTTTKSSSPGPNLDTSPIDAI